MEVSVGSLAEWMGVRWAWYCCKWIRRILAEEVLPLSVECGARSRNCDS